MQGDRHYDYDAYGNQIRERRGTGQKLVTEYRYDCQHRLIGVSLPGGSVASYKYDAFGRRIAKTVDGQTTEFLWQGERLIAESADNRYRSYIYEPGTFRPLAMLDGEGPLKAEPFYYQLDHLGTPQELTDYSGEIMWSAKYRAYGNLATLDIAEIDNPLRFQGQYFDAETGLHYNRHRYYNPGTGRYLTPDPIKLAGGLNNYQYVPNPTGWVDPLGLACGVGNCPKVTRDAQGRITDWEFDVTPDDIGTGSATNQAARDHARELGNATDDAGHARGNKLGGPGTVLDNIFPQAPSVNRGQFRVFEKGVAEHITENDVSASARLTAVYEGQDTRPYKLIYKIKFSDGTKLTKEFDN
ncbi:RHS domain-containing protein [Pseudomonas sp. LjRoot277]